MGWKSVAAAAAAAAAARRTARSSHGGGVEKAGLGCFLRCSVERAATREHAASTATTEEADASLPTANHNINNSKNN